MAIRVLGNKTGDRERVLKPKAVVRITTGNDTQRLTNEGNETPGVEHEPNGDDNNSESNADGESNFVDPESIASDSIGGDSARTYTGKRRGRKPGSGSKRSGGNTSTSKTTDAVASMLFVVHQVAGGILKLPSVQISKDGSQQIAEALLQVTQEYETELLSAKQMAWLNLAGVMGKVYFFDEKIKPIVSRAASRESEVQQAESIPEWMRPN